MAETVSTNQFKNGMHVEVDGTIYRIVEFQHVKPGKGGAFVRTKLKALESGAVVDKTFRAGEKMPRIRTEVINVNYLYNDGSDVHLMNSETFDQIALPSDSLADELQFMRENDTVQLLTVDESGWPRVALLSAGEVLATGPRAIALALWPDGTSGRRAGRDRHRARREGRHRLQRDQAGHARDGGRRAGAAVRQRR